MKNFRKVLALVLVVATLFSFTAMAGAYTDDAKITADYSEAVGVLSALGILKGYEDGSFNPQATIDRDEMAKMIAVLANAGDDSVNTLYAAQCNFADTANNWAKSYIGYCYNKGIISGRSATTFDPNGKVTGIETAKMLLVVLGFDAKEQGYTGVADSVWKVNVLRDAKNFGLLNNFAADFDVTKQITREQAAQMFMNALFCPVVIGTLSDNIVKISNAGQAGFEQLRGLDWTLIDAAKYGLTVMYGNVLVSNDLLIKLFNVDTAAANDCHGRPAIKWSFTDKKGNTTEKEFVKANLLSKVYNGKAATTATDFKSYKYTVEVYVDGVKETAATTLAAADAFTGNGVVTEVYVNDYAKKITVVVINTFIGKVANVSARSNTYDLVVDGNATIATGLKNTAGFANGTVVLFWYCSKDHAVKKLCEHDHAVVAAPSTTATITFSALGNKVDMFKADGKDYFYAKTYGMGLASAKINADDTTGKVKKVIYTDLNGYVMHLANPAPAAPAATDVAYFLGGTVTEYKDTVVVNGKGNGYWTNDMISFADAQKSTVKVDKALVDAVINRTTAYDVKGALLQYTVGDTLAFKAYSTVASGAAFLSAKDGEIIDGELYGNDNTKYMIHTAEGYKVIVGYRNLDKDYLAKHINGNFLPIQYFATNKIASHVYIDATYTTASEVFYVTGRNYAASWSDIYTDAKAYNVYDVLVDGEKAVLAVAAPEAGETPEILANGLYKANLVLLGAKAAMLTDGTMVPLYVNIDEIKGCVNGADAPADWGFYNDGFALSIAAGQLKIVDTSATDNYSYVDVDTKLTVIDIEYKVKYDLTTYEGYEVLDTIRGSEYPAFATWIADTDGNGDIDLIIREIV